jgi:phage gp36-like protein
MADSRYCGRSDIEDRFGVTNVSKWADLDDDEDATKIANRIDRAIEAASDDIDDYLRGGPYRIPLEDANGLVPRPVRRIAAILAGVWLYEARGTVDYDATNEKVAHGLQFARDEAMKRLRRLKLMVDRINAVRVGSSTPEAIETTTQPDEDSWIPRDDQ